MSNLLLLLLYTTITTKSEENVCIPSDGIATGNKDEHIYNQFTFISRDEWQANSWRNDICACTSNDTSEMTPLSDPYIITIHHTAIPSQSFSTDNSISKIQQIQEYHQYTHDWCDIAYNFLIDSAGNIFQGRPFWDDNETDVFPINTSIYHWPNPRLIQGSHSLNSNENNIGIAVLGCYDNNKTFCPNGTDIIKRYDSTYVRLIQLISWISGYYNIIPSNKTIVRHSYWKHTECPGNILGSKKEFNNIINDVQMTINDGIGLCYDYNTNDFSSYNDTGGICTNSQLCDRDRIVYTSDDDQCQRLGQICCRVGTDNNKGNNSKDYGNVYILV
eukprot:763437_1